MVAASKTNRQSRHRSRCRSISRSTPGESFLSTYQHIKCTASRQPIYVLSGVGSFSFRQGAIGHGEKLFKLEHSDYRVNVSDSFVLTSSEEGGSACSQTSIIHHWEQPEDLRKPFSQGWPFPPTSSDFDSGKAETLGIRQATLSGAAAARLPASTEVREGECLVAYRFVTRCANCAKQFGILWAMDSTRRVDP